MKPQPPRNWPFPFWNGIRVKPAKAPKPPRFDPSQLPDAPF
jgi:hypothetical protein